MVTTDYQFHRPMDDHAAAPSAAASHPATSLRTAFLIVAGNLIGAGLLIWMTG